MQPGHRLPQPLPLLQFSHHAPRKINHPAAINTPGTHNPTQARQAVLAANTQMTANANQWNDINVAVITASDRVTFVHRTSASDRQPVQSAATA